MPASTEVTPAPFHGSYLMPSLEHASVSDAMHPGVISVAPDATLTEIARVMASNHVHCVAVMGIAHEGGGESLAWGIVTDLEVVRSGLRDPAEQTAATLVGERIVNVEPTTPLLEAAELMLTHGVAHVLVVDPRTQRPVGILSTLDVAGVLAWGEA